VQAAATGLPVSGHLAIMSAMLILALILAPLTAAAALRISLN
jgi:heme exporter protein B